MDMPIIDRVDVAGLARPVPRSELPAALLEGEALHREFRPKLQDDYVAHLTAMGREGASIMHLIDGNEVRALAVWRTFLTTYCGRRFEIDDLVTAEDQRSKGYGATLLAALEAKARSLACDAVMLSSATWRVDAHRFYFRERYAIDAFQFCKSLS